MLCVSQLATVYAHCSNSATFVVNVLECTMSSYYAVTSLYIYKFGVFLSFVYPCIHCLLYFGSFRYYIIINLDMTNLAFLFNIFSHQFCINL